MDLQTLLSTARYRREKIIASVASHPHRFDECALQAVYDGTQAEVEAGTMGPAMLTVDEVTEKYGPFWNVVRRFPVYQGGKYRNIDDNTESCNNKAASRKQKVLLSSVSRQLLILRALVSAFPANEWPGVDADPVGASRDMRKAYRQCPLLLAHIGLCIVAVCNPVTHKVEFHEMLGQPFGASLAVLNFCRLSEWLCRVASRWLHIVLDHYFDDFSIFEPKFSTPSAFWSLGKLFDLFGFTFDQGKDVLPSSIFLSLGVVFDLWSVRSSLILKVRAKPERVKKVLAELAHIRERGYLARGEASHLVGKLLFLSETLFGRVGRCALGPFRARQYSSASRVTLTSDLDAAISWWKAALTFIPPRELPVFPRDERPTLLYTDASEEKGRYMIGGVIFSPRISTPLFFSQVVPDGLVQSWHKQMTHIGQLELLAGPVALATWSEVLSSCDFIHFIDNDSASSALIKGYSPVSDSVKIIGDYWLQAAILGAYPYIDRVESKSNIADGPSRGWFDDVLALGAVESPANLSCLSPDSPSTATGWWSHAECLRFASVGNANRGPQRGAGPH